MLQKPIRYSGLFFQMSHSRKQLLLKSAFYSLLMEYYIRGNKKKKLSQYKKNAEDTAITSVEQRRRISDVSKTIKIIDKRAPWKPMCLNLALVAKLLLKHRNIETTIRIGFKPRETGKEFEGHAWLTSEDQIITGWLKDLEDYRELT